MIKTQWYLQDEAGCVTGPFPMETLREMAFADRFTLETAARPDDGTAAPWRSVRQIPVLRALLALPTPPPPPPPCESKPPIPVIAEDDADPDAPLERRDRTPFLAKPPIPLAEDDVPPRGIASPEPASRPAEATGIPDENSLPVFALRGGGVPEQELRRILLQEFDFSAAFTPAGTGNGVRMTLTPTFSHPEFGRDPSSGLCSAEFRTDASVGPHAPAGALFFSDPRQPFSPAAAEQKSFSGPLVVAVPGGFWRPPAGFSQEQTAALHRSLRTMRTSLDVGRILNVAFLLRHTLLTDAPEFVETAERFARKCYFIPTADGSGGRLRPVWSVVPVLLLLWETGMLPGVDGIKTDAEPAAEPEWIGDAPRCRFPGETRIQTLPPFCAGRTLWAPESGRWVRIPTRNA